jgi:hypothetical protein
MELVDQASVERLTGLAFFTPSGAASAIHLGNIEMLRLDYGLKSFDIMRSRRGVVYPRKRHFYQRSPVFTIQGNQFHSGRMAAQLAGTRQANTTRPYTSNAVYTFNAIPGGAFNIGQHGIWIQSIKVGLYDKVEDYDYFLDAQNGWIWLPEKGGTIETGQLVTVTYTFPSQDLETYTAFDNLSQDGQLIVYAEDHLGPPARERWVMDVTMSIKSMPDADPAKFRSWTAEALILGNPTVYKRPQQEAWSEIFTDSGVLDLS